MGNQNSRSKCNNCSNCSNCKKLMDVVPSDKYKENNVELSSDSHGIHMTKDTVQPITVGGEVTSAIYPVVHRDPTPIVTVATTVTPEQVRKGFIDVYKKVISTTNAEYEQQIYQRELENMFLNNRNILEDMIVDFLVQNNDPNNLQKVWIFEPKKYNVEKTYEFVCIHKLIPIALAILLKYYSILFDSCTMCPFKIACSNKLSQVCSKIIELRNKKYQFDLTLKHVLDANMEDIAIQVIQDRQTDAIKSFASILTQLAEKKMDNAIIALFKVDEGLTVAKYNISYDNTIAKYKNKVAFAYITERFGTRVSYSSIELWLDPESQNECIVLLKNEKNITDISKENLWRKIVEKAYETQCNQVLEYLKSIAKKIFEKIDHDCPIFMLGDDATVIQFIDESKFNNDDLEKIMWMACGNNTRWKVINYIINKLPENYIIKQKRYYSIISCYENTPEHIATVTKIINILRHSQKHYIGDKEYTDLIQDIIKYTLNKICEDELVHLIDIFMQTLLITEDVIKVAYQTKSTYKVKQKLYKYLYLNPDLFEQNKEVDKDK